MTGRKKLLRRNSSVSKIKIKWWKWFFDKKVFEEKDQLLAAISWQSSEALLNYYCPIWRAKCADQCTTKPRLQFSPNSWRQHWPELSTFFIIVVILFSSCLGPPRLQRWRHGTDDRSTRSWPDHGFPEGQVQALFLSRPRSELGLRHLVRRLRKAERGTRTHMQCRNILKRGDCKVQKMKHPYRPNPSTGLGLAESKHIEIFLCTKTILLCQGADHRTSLESALLFWCTVFFVTTWMH